MREAMSITHRFYLKLLWRLETGDWRLSVWRPYRWGILSRVCSSIAIEINTVEYGRCTLSTPYCIHADMHSDMDGHGRLPSYAGHYSGSNCSPEKRPEKATSVKPRWRSGSRERTENCTQYRVLYESSSPGITTARERTGCRYYRVDHVE